MNSLDAFANVYINSKRIAGCSKCNLEYLKNDRRLRHSTHTYSTQFTCFLLSTRVNRKWKRIENSFYRIVTRLSNNVEKLCLQQPACDALPTWPHERRRMTSRNVTLYI